VAHVDPRQAIGDLHQRRTLRIAGVRQREADNIRAASRRTGGKVSGPGGAAGLLGLKSTTLASWKALRL
jgi:hypothetical protein